MKLCYLKENMKYQKENNIEVTQKQANMIIKKLHRHFKTPITKNEFTARRNGTAWIWNNYIFKISLPKTNISMLLVLHEYAHALATHRYNKDVHHTKKFAYQVDRVVRYAQKCNRWHINTPLIDTKCVESLIAR